MSTPETAVTLAIVLFGLGALATRLTAGNARLTGWIAFSVSLAAAVGAVWAAASVLLHGPGQGLTWLSLPSLDLALRLYVDGLSAVFLLLIAVVSVLALLHSTSYTAHADPSTVRRYYPNLMIFLGSLLGLVTTTDMVYFVFLFWQGMTLTGAALIRSENRNKQTFRAARTFLWMMQLACVLTLAGAWWVASPQGIEVDGQLLTRFDFDAVGHHLPALLQSAPLATGIAFLLFLAGFGIKVGMWPFGTVWLPDAHPAAPSPVSALLSGVMIKTGVYGLMRIFLWLVPEEALDYYPADLWGMLIAVLGTITLLHGTWLALSANETKRLLAYSTIGQAGYILLGLGAALILIHSPEAATRTLASVALAGALLHTLNHAVFKSLLFLNAGSVLHKTGTQDLNRLGGLARFMPLTAFTAAIASFSIAGIPLSSGFASKWTMFTASIQGTTAHPLLPILTAVAILTSALTLALFIKFYGGIFLSRTSRHIADRSQSHGSLEVNGPMKISMGSLALLCIGLGLLPQLGFNLVHAAILTSPQGLGVVLSDGLSSAPTQSWFAAGWLGSAVYVPAIVLTVILGAFVLAATIARVAQAGRRQAVPWLCGYAVESEHNRYRAAHFYRELPKALPWAGAKARSSAEDETLPAGAPELNPSMSSCSLEKS